MILTCPQCQTQYSLETAKLGVSGRVVRCVSCSHTWFQAQEIEQEAAEASAPPEQQPVPEKPAAVLEQEQTPVQEPLEPVDKEAEIFDAILSGVGSRGESASPPPRQEISPEVITYNPLGVGANAFGALTFFLCLSVTLLVLFAGQRPIIRHWPQMTLLYKTLGFHPHVPGDGLRISAVVAERRMDDGKKVLAVAGKMTNMSERAVAYPPLHVILKDEQMKVVKDWDIKAVASKLASGEDTPLKLQLWDAPAVGSIVEIHVSDK